MKSELFMLLEEIERNKGIRQDIIIEALENALISAYRKNYGAVQDVGVKIDEASGEIKVYAKKTVVAEVEQYDDEITLEEAHEISPKYQIGDIVEYEVTPNSFGRIAAQTARQVVLQRIREAEREKMFDDFSGKTNDILVGTVRRIERRNIMIDLGDAETVLMPNEQVAQDKYYVGQKIKVYVVEVANSIKGPHLVVSRSHPGLVRKLFEMEVPEVAQGIVEIKALSREPGSRTKIAVYSKDKDVDPLGACVGPRGMRVQNITDELRGEKIDIIKYSEDPAEYISHALSPAKPSNVNVDLEEKKCTVNVPEDQLSLAIGKEGQNVRLAARLTGWKIDIV